MSLEEFRPKSTTETRGICTARSNPSVLKPFEQIVGELNRDRRNKVFQVVTRARQGADKQSRVNPPFVLQILLVIQPIYSVAARKRQNTAF
ncbi:hypothetical protein [Caballeronia sp. LZ016]|uniref:hypothetical protein n=1 Tax=Caballeronia sp. LZ016 TaxID=3038554 RepID=UPI0028639AF3|nr:hypothetical protein [Caballeronia sp. LZ016]MDR5737137.1 hypothetical protein [Caballeronia sp. LZ016]